MSCIDLTRDMVYIYISVIMAAAPRARAARLKARSRDDEQTARAMTAALRLDLSCHQHRLLARRSQPFHPLLPK